MSILEPSEGPVKELPKRDEQPPGEGADRVATVGPTAAAQGNPVVSAPGQAPAFQDAKDPEKKEPPIPRVACELIPKLLHEAVRALLEDHKDLWAGELGKLDITPHHIEVTQGKRRTRSQLYGTGLHNRQLIAEQVAKQTQLGVLEPSQSERDFAVVIVPKSDGTLRFCVDYRSLNEITVKDTFPLPRMDDSSTETPSARRFL